ncbi:uncharacterized protein LOC142984584 [Anticarsia gemmatalis]|uniref:uncharacterized protein LOC142984584 n=1 Tax=Anticarsia gemmatalis TaxID=129554 RepID=UPI003F760EC9
MDSLDLLAREDEFKKLNKQLEKKTESLMKEIEQAMQKQDIFSEFSSSLTLSPIHTKKKHQCHQPSTPEPVKIAKKTTSSTKPAKNGTKFEDRSSSDNIAGINDTKSDTSDGIGTKLEVKEENRSRVCDCCLNKSNGEDQEFLYAFVSVNVKDNVLPQSFLKDRPTVESVCKFLSSKVKLMQEQIDRLQSTLNKKASQCDSHLSQLAELEGERMTLLNKCNNMKSSTADMKAKCMAIQKKLEEKEKLYLEQRSLCDKLSCDVKRNRTHTTSLEAKCATQQETIEHLTQQLETVKRAEKEFRDSTRTLSASHQTAISRLEAKLKAQTSRIDKQMALIENLRRQNVLLSTEAAVKSLEKEYSEYLQRDF